MTAGTPLLFFCTTSSPIGGVETWLDRTCGYVENNGFSTTVALVRGMQCNLPERFRQHHPDLNAVEVDGRGLNREGRVRAAMRCIRRVKPKIVLPLGVFDANDAVIRLKARGDDVRLVVHAWGNHPPVLADLEDYRDSIDFVVCPGKLTTRYLAEVAGFDSRRVRHIPNGADQPTTKRPSRTPGQPLRLGYVGRMTRGDKRVLDLPRLCRELAQRGVAYHLTIAGDGPAREQLQSELAPFAERIEWLGPRTLEYLYAQVYPRLDCLLLFSASEAFGIVLAEAMMNGVVPVTSRYIGFQSEQLVVDGEHGLSFPVGDMPAAADAIEELANDIELLARLSRNGQEHAESSYTWDRSLERWRDCLQEVAALPSQPPGVVPRPYSNGNRLDRWGVPPAVSDALRRVRRFVLGPPVLPGGEEWPLSRSHHSDERLGRVLAQLESLEAKAADFSSCVFMNRVS